jgi:predicted CoA-binding protein
MNESIQAFIDGKSIALAGASRSGNKFGNIACKELKARGYEVFLVHPEAKEIDGQPCYTDLASVRDKVDGLLVCVPASQAEKVLREAAANGLNRIWLQQGAETPGLLALGKELGLDVVSGKCILMYAQPVRSFHRWHRAFAKITGQL